MTTQSRVDRIVTWDKHFSDADVRQVATQTVPEYDDIGQVARCSASFMRHVLTYLEKGQSTNFFVGKGCLVHVHADEHIDKYYDINGVTVGNEYGFISTFMQILIDYLREHPEDMDLI
jgi:hypothetical protein